MIARTLVRTRRNAPSAVTLAMGLGLAASWSTQRQPQGASNPASLASTEGARFAAPKGTAGESKRESSGKDESSSKSHGDEEPTLREEVIGSYEDRIRNFSSAKRVFEFFASVTRDGNMFMTPSDFARSITPYQHRRGVKVGSDNFKYNWQAKHQAPTEEELAEYKALLKKILEDSRVTPQEVREMIIGRGRLNISAMAHLEVLEELGVTEKQLADMVEAKGGITRDSFVAMVDIDGDGLINYEEYMFFRTLLALPRRKLSIAFRMFDRDDSGTVDSNEFESFMEVLREETNVGRAEVSYSHKAYYADVLDRLFFSNGGNGQLTLERFVSFVELLQRQALVMQFNQWDEGGEGMLTATDFAKFLVTKVNSDRTMYKMYMERAESEAMSQLEVNISLEDFLAFHDVLQHLPEMEVAMKVSGSVEGRGLDREEFSRATKAALKGGRLRQKAGDLLLLGRVPTRTRKRDLLYQKVFGNRDASKSTSNSDSESLLPPQPNKDVRGPDGSGDAAGGEKEEAISSEIVDALFVLLDTNNNGRVDQAEFMTLMKRQSAVPDPPRSLGMVAFLRRVKDCTEGAIF